MASSTGAGTEQPGSTYWNDVLEGWEPTLTHRLWRAHSDAINVRLLRRWAPGSCDRLLKTDLFDEAVAPGLYPELSAHAREVVGIDIAPAVVRAAAERHPGLEAHVGDVLALPFSDASFDGVFSNSTLDHFDSRTKLRSAIGELARVLRPGGSLIITLDNRMNPIIALRTSRSLFGVLHRLGVVPYFVGATYGHRGLSRALEASGFEVRAMTAVMHCPPQIAASWVAHGRGASRSGGTDEADHVRRVLRVEAMERLPARHLTGHFVAALAIRR